MIRHYLSILLLTSAPYLYSMDQETWEQKVFKAWATENPNKIADCMASTEPTIKAEAFFFQQAIGKPVELKPHDKVLYDTLITHLAANPIKDSLPCNIKLSDNTSCWVGPFMDGVNIYTFTSTCDKSNVANLIPIKNK